MVDDEIGELVDPLVGGSTEESFRLVIGDHPVDVGEATDDGRVASCRQRCFVDDPVTRVEVCDGHRRNRGDPAIGGFTEKTQRQRTVDTEPDADVVGGLWTGFDTSELIVLTLVADRPFAAPHEPDDVDGFTQGLECLPGSPVRPPMAVIASEGACTESEFETAAAEEIDRRCSLRQDRWRAQGKAGDIRKDRDPLGSRSNRGEQGEGVNEPPLVRMVLDPDEVEALLIGNVDRFPKAAEIGGLGVGKMPKETGRP